MFKTYLVNSVLYALLFSSFSFSAFATNLQCEQVASNIGFAISQADKALTYQDINKAKFYAYKAINALEKTKKQLIACDCEVAYGDYMEGLEYLKTATRKESVSAAQLLLKRGVQHFEIALESLSDHHDHIGSYNKDVLALNTLNAKERNTVVTPAGTKSLNNTVDISLEKYRKSLDKIVNTVDCGEAKAFAQGIFDHCEAQLLRNDLSEGKKYYNLRTKEITLKALEKLGNCAGK